MADCLHDADDGNNRLCHAQKGADKLSTGRCGSEQCNEKFIFEEKKINL